MDRKPCPIPVLTVLYKNPRAYERLQRATNAQTVQIKRYAHSNTPPNPNLGYTAGMNRLVKLFLETDTYAVLLNHDAQPRSSAIEEAVKFMDEHPRCAIAGFKLLNSASPDEITHGGTGTPYPAGEHLIGRVSEGDHDRSRAFLWVNGAANIVRLEAIREIGLMDERFFLIGSDSDWCLTAWMKGWEVWYCAQAESLHDCDGCSTKPTPEQLEIANSDMKRWEEKWSAALSDPNNPLLGARQHA